MTERPVAIVTAAGRNIGAAIARELAERGYRLALMSPSGRSVALAEELGGFGINGSLTAAGDIERLVAETAERHGRIDAVVNNSGQHSSVMARHGVAPLPETTGASLSYDPNFDYDFLAIPDAAWREDIEMMVISVIRMARAVTPIMVRQGGGAIVNITGLEAEQPRLVYPMGPARLALHGITKNYADRYGRDGIRMNSVLPGTMANGEIPPEAVRAAVPMGRLGTMAELAKTVAFLLGPDSGYITGQMIRVDGGINRGL